MQTVCIRVFTVTPTQRGHGDQPFHLWYRQGRLPSIRFLAIGKGLGPEAVRLCGLFRLGDFEGAAAA